MQVRKKWLTLAASLFPCEAGQRGVRGGGGVEWLSGFSYQPTVNTQFPRHTRDLYQFGRLRRHILVSMATTISQSVGGQLVIGRQAYDCLLVFAVTITTLPDWTQRRKWRVPIVQITYWSKINLTLVQKKKKELQNYISLNRFFILTHCYTKSFSSTDTLFHCFCTCGEKKVCLEGKETVTAESFSAKNRKQLLANMLSQTQMFIICI